ncbi:MAG: methionine--tRNA ligase [Patescibacteria group bacterium]|nr:methionine--tRNA ligase [Patescibacteria group bacterium]
MKNKFYVTTSIFYVNSVPHIGSALEMVQADVLARYHRQLGENVFFLTGTDEHGIKIVRTAEEKKKSVQELVDKNTQKFKDLTKILNISNDDFIRTSDKKRHWPAVKKIWRILDEKGDIYKGKYSGLYCVGCEAYLSKSDLVDGKCPFHQKKPEIIKEENYFFKLSKYAPEIKKIIEKDELVIIPQTRKKEVLGLIKQGVKDISVSRPKESLLWGVPAPDDDSQICYVWFEALINYISALGYGGDEKNFERYWPADIHCIGKDILRFHTLLWPAMLLSVGLPLPKKVFVHGYLTSKGQKMSKSVGNVVDPFDVIEKHGSETTRYFLLREFSSTEDGDFSIERLKERYNSDLANGLGNLVSRVLTLAEKTDAAASAFLSLRGVRSGERRGNLVDSSIALSIKLTRENYKKAFEDIKFNEALEAVWKLISACDEYIEKNKPWELRKNNEKKFNEVISDMLVSIGEIADLLKPFMPDTAEKILEQIKQNKKSEALFPRIN